jgi:hypothetical protein
MPGQSVVCDPVETQQALACGASKTTGAPAGGTGALDGSSLDSRGTLALLRCVLRRARWLLWRMSCAPPRNLCGGRVPYVGAPAPQKGGAIRGPRGGQEGGRLWPAPVLPSVSYQPGDAPCWEDSARRPDSASALRVGVGLARPDGSVTRPYRSGLGRTRADGPPSPLVASLLPLAVRAGALAFAGLAGIRKGTRRRCTRTTRTREGPPRPALPTATRHDTALAPTLGVASR